MRGIEDVNGVRKQAWGIYLTRCDEVSRLAPEFEEEEVVDLIARAITEEREACLHDVMEVLRRAPAKDVANSYLCAEVIARAFRARNAGNVR